MAETDPELIALLQRGDKIPLADLATLNQEQLDALRLLALAQIGFDPKTPAAARVAALRDLGNGQEPGTGTGTPDPGSMDLDAIDAELAALSGTRPPVPQ